MRHIKDISWAEVNKNWKDSEDNEIWQDFYRAKGFNTWEEWREPRIKMLKLENREWNLEGTDRVIEEVRGMVCDATTRWADFYKDRNDSTFEKLKDHEFFAKHKKVVEMRENFPNGSQIIGLRNQGKIIVVDGHHRATALAGMDKNVSDPKVNFAIADIENREFEKLYKGGRFLTLERNIFTAASLIRAKIRNI